MARAQYVRGTGVAAAIMTGVRQAKGTANQRVEAEAEVVPMAQVDYSKRRRLRSAMLGKLLEILL